MLTPEERDEKDCKDFLFFTRLTFICLALLYITYCCSQAGVKSEEKKTFMQFLNEESDYTRPQSQQQEHEKQLQKKMDERVAHLISHDI